MLPPGLGFNAVSEKALAAAKANPGLRSYWEWEEVINFNKVGTFPYTPAINLLFGLREAIKMLEEEGLENVFARHTRHSEATRAAIKAWGLETQCQEQGAHSPALTGVRMPEGHDADHFRKVVLENFDMSLGTGLNKVKGKVFRIGHIGHFNDLMLMGTLSGVEMGMSISSSESDRLRHQLGQLLAQPGHDPAGGSLGGKIVHFVGIALEVVELVALDAVERLLRPVDVFVPLGADRLVAHADQPRHGVLAEVFAHERRAPAALAAALRQRARATGPGCARSRRPWRPARSSTVGAMSSASTRSSFTVPGLNHAG